MAKVKLDFGAEVDFLNKDELDDSLKAVADAQASARGAGIKPLRFIVRPFAAVSGTAGYALNVTPNAGYVWNLRYIASNLSSAQTHQYYLGTDTNTNLASPTNLAPLANAVSSVVGNAGFGAGQVLMYPEDYVVFYAGGSATLNAVHLTVWEVPAELIWKLE